MLKRGSPKISREGREVTVVQGREVVFREPPLAKWL